MTGGNDVRRYIMLALVVGLATACDRTPQNDAREPLRQEMGTPTASPISVLREAPPAEELEGPPKEPFTITIPFADGGTDLSEDASRAIAAVLASEQFKLGGKVTLTGHTDSTGFDEANIRASRKRAEAVARKLEESGATADNIEIIAMGEQRPIAPNAKPDASPDEDGRARNRRVEVIVSPSTPAAANPPDAASSANNGNADGNPPDASPAR